MGLASGSTLSGLSQKLIYSAYRSPPTPVANAQYPKLVNTVCFWLPRCQLHNYIATPIILSSTRVHILSINRLRMFYICKQEKETPAKVPRGGERWARWWGRGLHQGMCWYIGTYSHGGWGYQAVPGTIISPMLICGMYQHAWMIWSVCASYERSSIPPWHKYQSLAWMQASSPDLQAVAFFLNPSLPNPCPAWPTP